MSKPFDDDDIDMFGDDDDDFGMNGGFNFNGSSINTNRPSFSPKGTKPSPSFNMGNNNSNNNSNNSFNNNFNNNFIDDDFVDDESEFTGSSVYDDAPIQQTKSGTKMDLGESKQFKKSAFILVGLGVLLLIFAVVGIRVVKSVKDFPTTSTVVQQVTNDKNNPTNQNFVPSQKIDNTITNNFISSASAWQEVNLDGVDLGDLWIESAFTITEIKHYALITNTLNDKQLKTVVKGNISGLVGTYEMEIPTYKALGLGVGTTFSVTYQLKEQNGYKLVGHIKY